MLWLPFSMYRAESQPQCTLLCTFTYRVSPSSVHRFCPSTLPVKIQTHKHKFEVAFDQRWPPGVTNKKGQKVK